MKQSILVGIGVALVVIASIFAFQVLSKDSRAVYSNEQYQFSLRVPSGFAASDIPSKQGAPTVVVIQNDTGDGLQILISPFGEDLRDLSEKRIRAAIPNLVIQESSVMRIGDTHTGLLFTSNSEAFDGSSQEAWFVFKGNLYQVSTYARLQPLLEEVLGGWQFL